MNSSSIRIKDIAITGLLIALIFVATYLIKFQLPFSAKGGLTHAGTFMLFTIAFIFGKKKAAVSGALGMALFDLTSGWVAWAPFTFVIRAVMGYIAGSIVFSKKYDSENTFTFILKCGIAIIICGIWMCAGYYATEGILYGNWYTPIFSIWGNVLQIILGVFSIPMAIALKKAKIEKYI